MHSIHPLNEVQSCQRCNRLALVITTQGKPLSSEPLCMQHAKEVMAQAPLLLGREFQLGGDKQKWLLSLLH